MEIYRLEEGYYAGGFSVIATEVENYYVNFEVYEGEPYSELYLRCNIKWDSCCHFWFGSEDYPGYDHICGVGYFKNLMKLLEFLYIKAFELMGREPIEGEEWNLIISEGDTNGN